MNKNILTVFGVVAALVLGVFNITNTPETVTVVEKVPVEVGAVSGPDILSPYFSVGGARFWAANQTMQTGTTTVCSIQSPVATSTLVSGTVSLSVSSTTASTVTVARQTQGFSTTTRDFNNSLIRTVSIGANAQGQFQMATTSLTALADAQASQVYAPNSYIVVTMAGGVGTFSPAGTCTALFQQMVY